MHHRFVLAPFVMAAAAAALSVSCSSRNSLPSEPPAPVGAPPGVVGPRPDFGTTVSLDHPPPPISGGTLAVSRDGTLAFAADPDRDQVYVVDLAAGKLRATVVLSAGDEPGRLVEDAAGRIHVALRGGGALVTIDPATATVLARRPVCVAPRGVAYDDSNDFLHVACASGELVALPASGGPATRSINVADDLRDVITVGGTIVVSTYRSPALLALDVTGHIVQTSLPVPDAQDIATLAWRMVPHRGGVLMLHQLTSAVPVSTTPGGYSSGGGGDPGMGGPPGGGGTVDAGGPPPTCGGSGSIVTSALTFFPSDASMLGGPIRPAVLDGAVLAVDVAVSADGSSIAVAATGNGKTASLDSLQLYPRIVGGGGPDPCARKPIAQPSGQVIAVAFDATGSVLAQTREPAALFLPTSGQTILLSEVSRRDTGHDIFHSNAGGFIACASCHGEGGDDGHTWMFDTLGARRTPSLRGTVAGTAPYHWAGEMADFGALAHAVYTGRMSGADLLPDQLAALRTWVEAVPAPLAPPANDVDAVGRGKALFDSTSVGCSGCHNGPRLTNNLTVDVGTGGSFQVPPLVGVRWRTPLFHDGCAATLADRFAPPCASSTHGHTAGLQPTQVDDLVAYLQSL